MFDLKNNEQALMTRRYPDLRQKVLMRDSKIVEMIIRAEQDKDKVWQIYLNNHHKLSDQRYWELMRTVWIVCGNMKRVPVFRELMVSDRKHRYYFSTPEEAKRLRELPDLVIVYRATNNKDDGGLSWTLSEDYAKWYQETYQKDMIIDRFADKRIFFALIERNKEEEIIIL